MGLLVSVAVRVCCIEEPHSERATSNTGSGSACMKEEFREASPELE
jgi:hypothetical protein